jgi:hypothetical protein
LALKTSHQKEAPDGKTVSGKPFHRSTLICIAQLLVVLLCALTLKLSYSTSTPNQLRWILAPTTLLVELVSGTSFTFESHAGYISSDHTFLIAASCAGVNFLITSFLMLSLSNLWRDRSPNRSFWFVVLAKSKAQDLRPKTNTSHNQSHNLIHNPSRNLTWLFIPTALLFAYLATLVANTVRISTALLLHQTPLEITSLSPNQLHRFEGIFIYFGFLLLLFILSERMSWGSSPTPGSPAGQPGWGGTIREGVRNQHSTLETATQLATSHSEEGGHAPALLSMGSGDDQTPGQVGHSPFGLFRRSFFPLLIYYATTLGIPLANGAYRQRADFWEHSLFVLLTPLILILPLATFRLILQLKSRQLAQRIEVSTTRR